MRFAFLVVVVLAVIPMQLEAQLRQAPARRARPGPAVDPLTATISGRVTTADTGAPLAGAEVRTLSDGGVSRLATTDAGGRFEVRDLPAGTFRVAVSKSGFVSAQFGQRRPTEAARTIDLAQGELFTANVALLRGGVIAGRVFDRFGEPIAAVRVQAMRSRMAEGRRRLQPVGAGDETDDTGSFRVYGLAPGDYYVVARPAGAMNASPGRDSTPLYYPGTADFTEAQRITVTAAAEANAIMQIVPVRTATVSGVVLDANGAPVEATVNLTSQAVGLGYVNAALGEIPFMIRGHTEADGMFTLTGVPPGPYQLTASSLLIFGTDGRMRNPSEITHKTASVPVVVSGGDVGGLTLTLSAGGTISGSFVRDAGASQPLPGSLGVKVSGAGMSMGNTGPNGDFRLLGITGSARLSVEGLPEDWTVKSILADDKDVTDSPIEMTGGQDMPVRIVLTDRLTEVSGTVRSRTSPGEQTVVVFAEDAARWMYPSRFVRAARVDDRGRFRMTGLPPGDYVATAVEFLEEGDTQDPEILERLRDGGARFTLVEGERRTLELQSAGP